MFDRDTLHRDPERIFKAPAKVLENHQLSVEDKIEVLENWQLDLLLLQSASDENMPAEGERAGASGERLRQVNAALALLRRELGG